MEYAKIVKDYLFDPTDKILVDSGLSDRSGVVLFGTPPAGNPGTRPEVLDVRLLDDDRILYYHCLATDAALERLAEWGARDSGTTILQVKKDGVWTDEIS